MQIDAEIIGALLGAIVGAFAGAAVSRWSIRYDRQIAACSAMQALADQHLLGLGEPIDMAQAVLYLASDESRIVTGTILPVDSGLVTL